MKSFKDKYTEIFREHKILIEEKTYIQKQLDKTIQNK